MTAPKLKVTSKPRKLKTFKLKVEKVQPKPKENKVSQEQPQVTEEQPPKPLVQGQTATLPEYNFAQALDRLNLPYQFQYQLGIPGTRGSVRLDFVVYTVPMPTPVFVQGTHWHTGEYASETQLDLERARSMTKTWAAVPVEFWEDDLQTVDDAIKAIRAKLTL